MHDDRWRRVEELYQAAYERPVHERKAFLDEACAGDATLREEVESLLVQPVSTDGSLERAARGVTLPTTPSSCPVGTRLGPYEIRGPLGAGGMGDVYRARDGQLNRDVALKVLPELFALDPDRLARFRREAQVLASLNHPNIGAIYGFENADGIHALVLELVDGPTLADRLAQGPIPLREALTIARQMCEALAAAHEQGVIHRDLKPANIKLRPDGTVKVLDFGLAKVFVGEAAEADRSRSPTVTLGGTREGVILGTAAYMSPEQARAQPVDKRTDIWAFGCVLYEMLSGQPAFARVTITDTFVAILEHEPAREALPSAVPARIVSLLRHCLEKDVARRKRDLGDARFEIEDVVRQLQPAAPVAAAPVPASAPAATTAKPHRLLPRIVAPAGALVAIAMAASWWLTREPGVPVRLEVASITPITNLPGNKLDPVYSPDGSKVAFSWRGHDGDSPGIYVLDSDASAPRRLTQSAFDDVAPAWSPDGREIAFERLKPTYVNELMVVAATGDEPERKLRDVRQSAPLSDASRPLLAWTPDGHAIVVPTLDVDTGGRASLFRIGVRGEQPQRLFGSIGGDGDGYPAISPDGRWLAYAMTERNSARLFMRRLGAGGLPEGPPQEVPSGTGTIAARFRSPTWSPDGSRLVFAVGSRVIEWEIGGASRELWVSGDRIQALTPHWTDGVLSELVFATLANRAELREVRLDAEGRRAEGAPVEFMPLGWIGLPQFSPDGRWLTFNSQGGAGGLWIATADGSNPRLLANIWAGSGLRISPDSRHIAFHKVDELFAPLYVVDLDANGAMAAVRKVAQTNSFGLVGASWSADGQYLYTTAINKTPPRVMRARVSDGELEDLFDGVSPVVAADGRRLFYRKGQGASPLFARSVDGDTAANPEEQLVSGCVVSWGIAPTSRGIYYVACDQQQTPVSLRYFEFSTRRSYEVGPPPRGEFPALTVSADGRRLVYHTTLPDNGELTRVTFRPAAR